jgi:hypothetical protein
MTLEELKATHWATLKKMVEDAGGTYEDKESSIQFLIDADAANTVGKTADEETKVDSPVEDIPTLKIDEPVLVANKKSSITLDKSRPFGEIFGEVEGYPNARYTQGDHIFNSLGEKI